MSPLEMAGPSVAPDLSDMHMVYGLNILFDNVRIVQSPTLVTLLAVKTARRVHASSDELAAAPVRGFW